MQIYHVGTVGGLPYFELEYLAGGSLDKRLDGTPWSAFAAAELVETLARAIAEAHRQGVVHRDLKPANILLDTGLLPKVADFGLAKMARLRRGHHEDPYRARFAQLHGSGTGPGKRRSLSARRPMSTLWGPSSTSS